MIYIKTSQLYTPAPIPGDTAVLIEENRIVAAGPAAEVPCPPGARLIDATGFLVVPGFIDLQFNGGFGADFTAEPATIWQVAAQLPRYGVTAFLPTIITSPLSRVSQAQEVVVYGRPAGYRATVPLGLHVEGPFLNPQKKGAHNPAYLRQPDLGVVADWSPEQGVRLVTLAPELPGALPMVEALAGRGVLVSAGHSMATYAEAMAAFDAGIRYGTHLFNAMPNLLHREPGLPGALLTDDRPVAGLIADGIHTHPAIVRLIWACLGSQRLNLVTDAMAALGMAPGMHLLGDFEVQVDATSARLADGILAGSILALDQALRNLMAFTGCPLPQALATITTTPARALSLAHSLGRIAPGYNADLVLLDSELTVRNTIVAGEVVFAAA